MKSRLDEAEDRIRELEIDHMIGHKTSLNKIKKIEIISSIFSDQKELKLETNLKEKTPDTQTHGD